MVLCCVRVEASVLSLRQASGGRLDVCPARGLSESGMWGVAGMGSSICLQEEQLRKGDSVGECLGQVCAAGGGGRDPGPKAPLHRTALYRTGGTSGRA